MCLSSCIHNVCLSKDEKSFSAHTGLNSHRCRKKWAPYAGQPLPKWGTVWMFRGFGGQEVHCTSTTVPVKTYNRWLSQLKLDQKLKAAIPRHWLASQFSHREDPNPHLPLHKHRCMQKTKVCLFLKHPMNIALTWLLSVPLSSQILVFLSLPAISKTTSASVHGGSASLINNRCSPWLASLKRRLAEFGLACACTCVERKCSRYRGLTEAFK